MSDFERIDAKRRRSNAWAALGEFAFLHNINKINCLRLSKMPKSGKGKLFLLTSGGFCGMISQNGKYKNI